MTGTSLQEARRQLAQADRVVVLTGAGVSAPSGIPTFRDAQEGLWARYRPEDLASPGAYARDPHLVWDWYAWRYGLCAQATPNRAHDLLAALERRVGKGFTLVTQNVDGLHGRAGSGSGGGRLLELHGNITRARCEACGARTALPEPAQFTPPPTCGTCGSRMRPDVVWFGENLPPDALEGAWSAFGAAQVALVIGTSAVVQPAASLAHVAKDAGALVIEVNPDMTPLSAHANLTLHEGAVEGLTRLLE